MNEMITSVLACDMECLRTHLYISTDIALLLNAHLSGNINISFYVHSVTSFSYTLIKYSGNYYWGVKAHFNYAWTRSVLVEGVYADTMSLLLCAVRSEILNLCFVSCLRFGGGGTEAKILMAKRSFIRSNDELSFGKRS
jgi:hypothetical protein